MKKFALHCTMLLIASLSRATEEPFRWEYEVRGTTLDVSATISPNHYLYSDRTSVELLGDDGSPAALPETYPVAEDYQDEFGDKRSIYPPGVHNWKFADMHGGSKLKVEFQGCSKEPFMCFPPKKIFFNFEIVEKSANDKTPPSSSDTQTELSSKKIEKPRDKKISAVNLAERLIAKGGILLIIGALIGGLLSAFTPCVLPMIPITLAILGNGAGNSKLRAFTRALLYVIGIVITFTSLALFASISGKTFGVQILGNPLVLATFAVIFIFLGFSMLGFYELDIPSAWRMKLDRIGGGTNIGAMLMGLVAGFVAVPCTGPILATLLGIAALSGNVIVSLAIFSSYATGFGLPFLLIGSGLLKTPKSGAYMDKIKSVLGILILTIANFAFFMAFPIIKSSLVEIIPKGAYPPVLLACAGFLLGAVHADGHSHLRRIKGMKAAGSILLSFAIYWSLDAPPPQNQGTGNLINWRHSLDKTAFDTAKKEEKKILLDFGAEWCTACREMDALTFSDSRVAEAVNKKTIPIKIDATITTPEIENLLSKYNVKGFPTFLLLAPDETIIKERTGFFPAKDFLEWLD